MLIDFMIMIIILKKKDNNKKDKIKIKKPVIDLILENTRTIFKIARKKTSTTQVGCHFM